MPSIELKQAFTVKINKNLLNTNIAALGVLEKREEVGKAEVKRIWIRN